RLTENDKFFSTPVAGTDWHLGTILLFGSRYPYKIQMLHQLLVRPNERMPLTECSAIVNGIISPIWEVATESSLAAVLESLIGVSRFALAAAPAITSQITDHSLFPYPENLRLVSN
ncbi:MAG: hypothetical protein KGL39_47815, partial [Patescibacteria group bacterium]|nr:hypothetical protein [Patescibacteria group bacterium]